MKNLAVEYEMQFLHCKRNELWMKGNVNEY